MKKHRPAAPHNRLRGLPPHSPPLCRGNETSSPERSAPITSAGPELPPARSSSDPVSDRPISRRPVRSPCPGQGSHLHVHLLGVHGCGDLVLDLFRRALRSKIADPEFRVLANLAGYVGKNTIFISDWAAGLDTWSRTPAVQSWPFATGRPANLALPWMATTFPTGAGGAWAGRTTGTNRMSDTREAFFSLKTPPFSIDYTVLPGKRLHPARNKSLLISRAGTSKRTLMAGSSSMARWKPRRARSNRRARRE